MNPSSVSYSHTSTQLSISGPQAQDHQGRTPLWLAASRADRKAVQRLGLFIWGSKWGILRGSDRVHWGKLG